MKTVKLMFLDENFRQAFERLRGSSSQAEKRLYAFITKALDILKDKYESGIIIPVERIPKVYKQFGIKNLFVLELPPDWRIFYTVVSTAVGDEIQVIDMTCDRQA